jgi:hypothetical protein
MRGFLLACLFATGACGDGLTPGSVQAATDYFPLARGAVWEYRNLGGPSGEQSVRKEITGCEEISFVDCVTDEDRTHLAFVQETTGTGDPDDLGVIYVEATDEGIYRVKQDFLVADALDHWVTYSPYFMRLFPGPYTAGREEFLTHERCEYDGSGIRNQTTRDYRHTVVGSQSVDVPAIEVDGETVAGPYDALVIERVDVTDGSTKRYYWLDGVGKVYEEEILGDGAVGETEELVSYTSGDGSC